MLNVLFPTCQFLCLNRHQKYITQSNDNKRWTNPNIRRKFIVSTMHKLSNNSHNSCVQQLNARTTAQYIFVIARLLYEQQPWEGYRSQRTSLSMQTFSVSSHNVCQLVETRILSTIILRIPDFLEIDTFVCKLNASNEWISAFFFHASAKTIFLTLKQTTYKLIFHVTSQIVHEKNEQTNTKKMSPCSENCRAWHFKSKQKAK